MRGRSLLSLAVMIPVVTGASVASDTASAGSMCRPDWIVYHTPNVGRLNNFLYSVSAVSGSNAWSVGYWDDVDGYPRALIEHWDGDSWKVLERMPDSGSGASLLLGVSAVSADDVWAAGYRGGLPNTRTLIEHRGPNGWKVTASPNVGSGPNLLYAVSAAAADDAWAVGAHSDGPSIHTLIEHWDGSAWTVVGSPNVDVGSNKLTAVTVSAPDDVWAVGGTTLPTGTRQTLTEHWDGEHWSIVESENAGDDASALAGVSDSGSRIMAVGSSRDSDGHDRVLVEVRMGGRWALMPGADPGRRRDVLNGLTQLENGDVLAVGGYGDEGAPDRTLVERQGASGMVNEPAADLGTSGAAFLGVAALSAGDAWAVGYRAGAGSARTLVERRCG